MAARQASITVPGEPHRKDSIAAVDMPHLAPVTTHIAEDATRAASHEKAMSLGTAIKQYPKAIMWSVLISTCIVMEGFDIVLISSLYALPAFQKRFGVPVGDGSYQITAAWQSGLSNGALVGELLGLTVVGWLAERWGYRKTLIAALAQVIGFIFLLFFAQNLIMLLVGLILCGISWGAFQTLTTTYASEVCPVALRAYLTTYVNLCWVIGQFLSSAVLKSVSNMTSQLAYKIPYGLQWIWPIPLIVVLFLAPESPWWLVRKDRLEDAKRSLLRLNSLPESEYNVDETINMMIYTNELEKAHTAGATYMDCFRGVDLRRTEIVCIVWSIQTLCGSAFMGYSTYFYEQAGLNTSHAFSLSLGQYALGAVGTIASWFLMGFAGRRTLYLYGQIALLGLLVIIGCLGIPKSTPATQWGIGSMLLVYTFVYDLTVGPVCYSLVAELASTRLRNKSVVLARNLYNITGLIANVLTPRMLNPSAWNWGAKAAFFWAGSALICTAWTFFRLPEPKGRTFTELDILFDAKVPARKFKSTAVESFAADSSLAKDHDSLPEKNDPAVAVEKV